MFNKIILVGNLTRDPELRYLPNGGAVCSAGIATNRKFKRQDGTPEEEVCFVDITFFGRTAEIANQYLNRGKKVLIEGRLKFDQWTDQNGGKRSKHSVIVENLQMLGGNSNNDHHQTGYKTTQSSTTQNQQTQTPNIDIDEDEIPF